MSWWKLCGKCPLLEGVSGPKLIERLFIGMVFLYVKFLCSLSYIGCALLQKGEPSCEAVFLVVCILYLSYSQ